MKELQFQRGQRRDDWGNERTLEIALMLEGRTRRITRRIEKRGQNLE